MPNESAFSANTAGAHVSGTLRDKLPINPNIPPLGLQAIGARVTLAFKGLWDADAGYMYYDVVHDAQGASYIAKSQTVPAGTALTDTDYWVRWADPNAQYEELETIVNTFNTRITNAETTAATASADVATMANGLTEEIADRTAADTTLENTLNATINSKVAELNAADTALDNRLQSVEANMLPKAVYFAHSPISIYLSYANGDDNNNGTSENPVKSLHRALEICNNKGYSNVTFVLMDSGTYDLLNCRFISSFSLHIYKANPNDDCVINIADASDFCWYNSHINFNGANNTHPLVINISGASRNYVWFDNCLTTFSYVKFNYPIVFYGGAFYSDTWMDVQTIDFECCNALINGSMIIHGSDNMDWAIRARACVVYISANITTDINITADKQGNSGFITLSGALLMFRTLTNTTVPAYKYAFGITATGSTIHLATVEYSNLAKLANAPAQLWRNTILAQGNLTILPGSDTVPTA